MRLSIRPFCAALSTFALVVLSADLHAVQTGGSVYYPGSGDQWEHRAPEQVGMDAVLLKRQ